MNVLPTAHLLLYHLSSRINDCSSAATEILRASSSRGQVPKNKRQTYSHPHRYRHTDRDKNNTTKVERARPASTAQLVRTTYTHRKSVHSFMNKQTCRVLGRSKAESC